MARAAEVEAGGETRERILRAALEDFSANGFDGARTREIAARAGVPLGLLRYHFGDKAKLWRAAVDRAFAELGSELDAILRAAPPADLRERLRRLVRGYVRFVGRNPEFVRLMHDEGKRRGPRMRWMADRHVKPVFATLAPLVEEAQAEGVLPAGIDPVHFFYVLAGAAGLIFHQAEECKRVSGIDPAEPSAVEAHARAVEHLFLGPAEAASRLPTARERRA
jgi:TetR/AcrR family transcriptional regulator